MDAIVNSKQRGFAEVRKLNTYHLDAILNSKSGGADENPIMFHIRDGDLD